MRGLRIAFLVCIAACGSSSSSSDPAQPSPAASTPPAPDGTPTTSASGPARIDELGYVAALHQKRPELFAQTNVCYDNLVLRPALRSAVLDAGSSYDDIVKAQYTDAQRSADLAWMKDQQATEVAFCTTSSVGGCSYACPTSGASACGACPASGFAAASGALPQVYPSGYGLCAFVGWAEGKGPGGPKFDPSGVITDWKVLGELRDDYATTFSGAKFLELAQKLADAGFRGDAKTPTDPSLPEQIHVQYNNVIVHGWSPSDGKIAEKVLDAFFGDALIARGRGVDVKPAGATAAMDWHHFLCAYDVSTLSDIARAYVTYAD